MILCFIWYTWKCRRHHPDQYTIFNRGQEEEPAIGLSNVTGQQENVTQLSQTANEQVRGQSSGFQELDPVHIPQGNLSR